MNKLLLVAGFIILGIGLILGPFGIPGDAAGIAMIGAASAAGLGHGK